MCESLARFQSYSSPLLSLLSKLTAECPTKGHQPGLAVTEVERHRSRMGGQVAGHAGSRIADRESHGNSTIRLG
jgi:hypothetical protein